MEENEEQNKKKSRGRKMVRKGSRKITKKPSRIDDEGGLSQRVMLGCASLLAPMLG